MRAVCNHKTSQVATLYSEEFGAINFPICEETEDLKVGVTYEIDIFQAEEEEDDSENEG